MLYIDFLYLPCKILSLCECHWTKCFSMWTLVNISFMIILCSLVSEHFATFCTSIVVSMKLKVWEFNLGTKIYRGVAGHLHDVREVMRRKRFQAGSKVKVAYGAELQILVLKKVKKTKRWKSKNKNISDCLSYLQGFSKFGLP